MAGVAHLPKAKRIIALDEGFKEAQVEFAQASSEEEAQTKITLFRDLVNRNQVQGNERNIDFWRKQGWEAFNQFVSTKSQEKSKTQEKRSKVEGKSITIHEDPNWLVVVPIDKDASCYHGKNTDWCTTKPNRGHFEDYFYSSKITLIYCLQLATGNKWAIAVGSHANATAEYFDKQDNAISKEQFQEQTGLDPADLIQKTGIASTTNDIQASRAQYIAARELIQELTPFEDLPPDTDFAAIERALWLTKDVFHIIRYCANVKGRWPKVEQLISADLDYAVDYATRVIKGRWPEIEQRLLDNEEGLQEAINYAADVIKGSWPELEDKLLTQEPEMAFTYALDVTRRRLPPKLEQVVLPKLSSLDRREYQEMFM